MTDTSVLSLEAVATPAEPAPCVWHLLWNQSLSEMTSRTQPPGWLVSPPLLCCWSRPLLWEHSQGHLGWSPQACISFASISVNSNISCLSNISGKKSPPPFFFNPYIFNSAFWWLSMAMLFRDHLLLPALHSHSSSSLSFWWTDVSRSPNPHKTELATSRFPFLTCYYILFSPPCHRSTFWKPIVSWYKHCICLCQYER